MALISPVSKTHSCSTIYWGELVGVPYLWRSFFRFSHWILFRMMHGAVFGATPSVPNASERLSTKRVCETSNCLNSKGLKVEKGRYLRCSMIRIPNGWVIFSNIPCNPVRIIPQTKGTLRGGVGWLAIIKLLRPQKPFQPHEKTQGLTDTLTKHVTSIYWDQGTYSMMENLSHCFFGQKGAKLHKLNSAKSASQKPGR